MNKINFLRGLLTISSLDKDLTAEIEKLKKYYLEVNYTKEKNELVNSVFEVSFDIDDAKNNFDSETKELFFNSAILISEIQLNKEKKDDLVLEYAKKLDFDLEKLNSIKDNLKKELAKNLDFTPFNWLCRMIKGYFLFKEKGITNIETYYSFRLLHFLTNGRLNNLLLTLTQVFNSYEKKDISKNLFVDEYQDALKLLKKDGVYVFKKKLPKELLDIALNYANNNNCYPVPSEKPYAECFEGDGVDFKKEIYQTARYDYKVADLVDKKDFFDILDKCNFTDLAREYFDSKALLDVIRLWWGTPIKDKFDRYTGQVFHIDIDRASSILFIIYLTDVVEETSPHVYVKGSHKQKPFNLLQDRRMVPEDIENNYKKEDVLKIIGEKGTIIAIDPMGFHRGQPLDTGNRLALKYQFSNDGFGEPLGFYKINDEQAKEKIKEMQKEYDFTFSRFLLN